MTKNSRQPATTRRKYTTDEQTAMTQAEWEGKLHTQPTVPCFTLADSMKATVSFFFTIEYMLSHSVE